MTELVTVEPTEPAELISFMGTVTPEQAANLTAALEASLSKGTRDAYASTWRVWERWCATHGHTTLPAHPGAVAVWVVERAANGIAYNTIQKDVAALRHYHSAADLPDPTSAKGVRDALSGLRRTYGVGPRRRAHALVTNDIARVLEHIDRTTLRGKRDAALVLVGFAAALRRSELAALHVRDIEYTTTGMRLTVARSKVDQEGKGAVVGIVRGRNRATDPVHAVREYLRAADIAGNEPLFQRIAPRANRVMGRGMTGQAVAMILVERANAAGLADLPISGHSLRAGHATAAAEAGVDLMRIARTTRHAHLAQLAEYVRPVEVMRDTSSADLGL